MAQHDYVIDNASGAVVRSDLNSLAQAIVTLNSGATAPSTTYAYMWWIDTSGTPVIKQRNSTNTGWVTKGNVADTFLATSDIGATVQAYDADTAKTDVLQTFTASQRGTITTDNDASFDLSVTNNFFCTPTGPVTLTFTNHASGQSGLILFVNGSNYSISSAATTKINSSDLTTLSSTGTYLIAYLDNGTNAYCVVSRNLA